MATYERLDYGSADGSRWGSKAADKLGFYGKVPVIQRAYTAAVHETSLGVSSASFDTAGLAILQEIQNTLVGLGIWATVA